MSRALVKDYYYLTKPGIVYGNILHVLVGYLVAYRYGLTMSAFIGVFFGVAMVIASACVANNYLDRKIDSAMKRTKRRALVKGSISGKQAIVYSCVLGAVGFGLLLTMTNSVTVLLGVVAYFWYVWIYGFAKRTTFYSTIIGSVPGALPIMAGYTAVSNTIDSAAWALFAMLCLWQIPHFYAIAVARKKEYANAHVPIITAHKSNRTIRSHMLVWTGLYMTSVVVVAWFDVFHVIGSVLLLAITAYWLWHMMRGYSDADTQDWGMRSFRLSLMLPIGLLVAASLTVVLA